MRIGRENAISKSARVCEDHFDSSQFAEDLINNKKRLRGNAVPSLNLGGPRPPILLQSDPAQDCRRARKERKLAPLLPDKHSAKTHETQKGHFILPRPLRTTRSQSAKAQGMEGSLASTTAQESKSSVKSLEDPATPSSSVQHSNRTAELKRMLERQLAFERKKRRKAEKEKEHLQVSPVPS